VEKRQRRLHSPLRQLSPLRPLDSPYRPFAPSPVRFFYRRFLLANTNCAVTFVRVTRTTSTSEAVQASWIR
jgi:hypothetical protein